MKILIADDDPTSRRTLELALKRWGYEVVSVCDGLNAWRVLQEEDAPRFAILDWTMPGMEGVQICEEVRKQEGGPYTYLLLLSAKDQKGHIVEGMDAGADDYITKPFDLHELGARLRAGRRILELHEELEYARQDLLFRANHDGLTGLLNRPAVLEALEKELERAKSLHIPVGVLIVDLDYFKQVNDLHGHSAGDEVLKEVARRMVVSTRQGSDKVGRYGGEEFLIILPGCNETRARQAAQRIRLAVERQPIELEDVWLRLTCSLGVTAWPSSSEIDISKLINTADAALYEAKRRGRNRVELFRLGEGMTSVTLLTLGSEKSWALQNSA